MTRCMCLRPCLFWLRRTITDQLQFVPYGKSVNNDPVRMQYMEDMMGYCKTILIPNVNVYEQLRGGLPKHLQNVRQLALTPLMAARRMSRLPVFMQRRRWLSTPLCRCMLHAAPSGQLCWGLPACGRLLDVSIMEPLVTLAPLACMSRGVWF